MNKVSTVRKWRLKSAHRMPAMAVQSLLLYTVFGYSRVKSTKCQSFYTTTFSASLTHLTALLPQSRDTSCYVSRPILAPPPLWLHKHTWSARTLPTCDVSLGSLTLPAPEAGDFVGLNLLHVCFYATPISARQLLDAQSLRTASFRIHTYTYMHTRIHKGWRQQPAAITMFLAVK